MIEINGRPADIAGLKARYPTGSAQRDMLDILAQSSQTHFYSSVEELEFELRLRTEIIRAADDLYKSGLAFKTFANSTCNKAFWIRGQDGGFELRPDVRPSDAIRDIYENTSLYGTECATAMLFVYYKALLDIFPAEVFDALFPSIYLMNWRRVEWRLREVGVPRPARDFLPGDRRYFANPDVNPATPEWQGENVIDLSGGVYYGHGLGRGKAPFFLNALNRNRRQGADKEAYLMPVAARPDFRRFAELYDKYVRDRGA